MQGMDEEMGKMLKPECVTTSVLSQSVLSFHLLGEEQQEVTFHSGQLYLDPSRSQYQQAGLHLLHAF